MLVKDMMRQVWTVSPDASLVIAARAMRDQEVDCLPVVEGDRLLGMITDRDLVVRGVAAGLDPACATVRMAMSGNAVTASTEDPVERVRELMAAHRITHLPVLDRRERVVGLISLRDLTGQFARCKPHEVTFYKRLANSAGHLHDVEVGKVYLSPAISKDEAVTAALAQFAEDRGLARWDEAADDYRIKNAD